MCSRNAFIDSGEPPPLYAVCMTCVDVGVDLNAREPQLTAHGVCLTLLLALHINTLGKGRRDKVGDPAAGHACVAAAAAGYTS